MSSMNVEEYFKISKTPVYSDISTDVEYFGQIMKSRTKAMNRLRHEMPFFYHLGTRKRLIVTDSKKITGVVTDLRFIYYPYSDLKERFENGETFKQVANVIYLEIVHAIMHLALYHHDRFLLDETINKRLFKIACDISVFFQLEKTQKAFAEDGIPIEWDLPDMAEFERFKGKTVDQIYKTLKDELPDIPEGGMGVSAGGGGSSSESSSESGESSSEDDEESGDETEETGSDGANGENQTLDDLEKQLGACRLEDINDVIDELDDKVPDIDDFVEAERENLDGEIKNGIAKGIGNLPGGLEQDIKSKQETKVNWKAVLQRYLTPLLPIDFQMKPNKKYLAHDLLIPSVRKEGMNVMVYVDTSGSVTDSELQQFVTEVRQILASFSEVEITLVDIDTEIQQVRELTGYSSEDEYASFKGRGGTSFMPAFTSEKGRKLISEKNPSVILYYTDGFARDYPQAGDVRKPLIWMVTTKPEQLKQSYTIPYGEMIYVDPNRD